MKRYRLNLPPLDTLLFFEAAYRVGGFRRSAAEMNVSQAAVSKRIRQLEEWMGEPLFVRDGNRLRPTPLGEKLYQTSSMTLEFLHQGLSTLRIQARRPLSIGANTPVGMFWLTPHLRDFGLSSNACPTRLITSDDPQDLFDHDNDLTVTYGDGALPGRISTRLFGEELTPMASPEIADRFDGVSSIHEIPPDCRPTLLNFERASPDWVDWRVWFQRLSFPDFDAWPNKTLSTYSQTIGDAIKGKGIALGSIRLLRAEVASGSLRRIGSEVLTSGRGYYISHGERSGLSEGAKSLMEFLIIAARREAG
ncbi:LysR family transcriptional regulator [Agrobacterium rhizogenes]|nr:LysR family transcriptional regulator [Rhizobium rhizogenes]NTJ78665.1 LysR family transcriptional regulator [Rhizobium rhizogenes]